jgi:hypothetical protein
MVGLGEAKPGQRENHQAMAQARRCTVTLLAADTGATPATTASSGGAATDTASVADTDDATPTAQGNGGDEVNTQQPK